MNRFGIAATLAALLAGNAPADIPPPEPEHPLGETCQPFIGVWHRVEPRQTRGGKAWWVLAIDSEDAVVLNYNNQDNINIQADVLPFALACTVNPDKSVTLDFSGENEMKLSLTVMPVDETTFTTAEETNYLGAGPPDPNWKPEPVTVVWKRVAK